MSDEFEPTHEGFSLFCGNCDVAAVERVEPEGDVHVFCPVCGRDDPVSDAIREVGLHQFKKGLDDVFKAASAGDRNITFKRGSEGHNRWIAKSIGIADD